MDRAWLLTWTTYGQWLPGDARGFGGAIRTPDWTKIIHNTPGEPYDSDLPALLQWCRDAMNGPPVFLSEEQARPLLEQFKETARYRGWFFLAVAIMANHVHAVVGVAGDPEPSTLLQGLKSYGSRTLNRMFGRQSSGTWWTESGSKRRLDGDRAVEAGVAYVENQEHALLIWSLRKETASGGRESPGALDR